MFGMTLLPGLKSNVGYDLHASQASGAGSILSFSTGDVEFSKIVVEVGADG
jgi:cystathionine beta-lyase